MSESPVRCFTCGKIMFYDLYKNLRDDNLDKKQALDRMNLRRICCRRMIISNHDNTEKIIDYKLIKN